MDRVVEKAVVALVLNTSRKARCVYQTLLDTLLALEGELEDAS